MILTGFVAVALSKSAELQPCTCASEVTLPGAQAVGVAGNARTWHLGPAFDAIRSEGGDGKTSIDDVPPAKPDLALRLTAIAAHDGRAPRLIRVSLAHAADADTAFVRIVLSGEWVGAPHATDQVMLYAIPGADVCNGPDLAIPSIGVTARITAIDLAGNESEAVVRPIEVVLEGHPDVQCGDPAAWCRVGDGTCHERFRCGTGMLALYLFAGAVFLGVALALVVIALVRRFRVRNLSGTPVPLLAAEALGRRAASRNLVLAGLGMVAVIGLLAIENTWAVPAGFWPVVALYKLAGARRLLARLGSSIVVAERRDDYLWVADERGTSYLRASPRAFLDAQGSAIATVSSR